MKTFQKGDIVTNKRYAAMGKSFTYVEHHKTARGGDSHEVRNSGGMPDFFGDDAGLYVVNPAPAPFKKGDRVEHVDNKPGFVMTVVADQYTSGAVQVEWPNGARDTEQSKHLKHADPVGETMTKPRVYLAGPMRGRPAFNFPAFDHVAGWLRTCGWEVFNPADHDRKNGFDTKGMAGHEDLAAHGFDLRAALAADLAYITTKASAVAVLPGWHSSSGARAEVATAHALGLPVALWTSFRTEGRLPRGEKLIQSPTPPSGTIKHDNGGALHAGPATLNNDTADAVTFHTKEQWEATAAGQPHIGINFNNRKPEPVNAAFTKPIKPARQAVEGRSGEVRTTSSTGGQKGVKPEMFSLLPVEALGKVATHYGIGAAKYDRNQWRKGYEWSKSYDAMMRHAQAFWGGENIDEETQSPHMAAVAFHALTLLTFMDEQPDHDDRYKP